MQTNDSLTPDQELALASPQQSQNENDLENMASLYLQQNDLERAVFFFEKAGTHHSYVALGKLYYKLGRLRESEQAFLKAKEMSSSNIDNSTIFRAGLATPISVQANNSISATIPSPLLTPLSSFVFPTKSNRSSLTTLLSSPPNNSICACVGDTPFDNQPQKQIKFIRVTHFDPETQIPVSHSVFADDPSAGNINIRAFRLRNEFPDAQIEIIDWFGDEKDAPPRNTPIPKSEYLEHKIRDWLLVALSKLSAGSQLSKNVFNSVDKLPITSERLRIVLQQVISHSLYRGQRLFLKSCDNVVIKVEGGTIIQEHSESCPSDLLSPIESGLYQNDEEAFSSTLRNEPLRDHQRKTNSRQKCSNSHHKMHFETLKSYRVGGRNRFTRSVSPLSIPTGECDGENVQLCLTKESSSESEPESLSQSSHFKSQNSSLFSVAIANLHNRGSMNVVSFDDFPETLEEFLCKVEETTNKIERQIHSFSVFGDELDGDSSSKEDDNCEHTNKFTRVFTTTGRELSTIEEVLSYCVPSVGSKTQDWGIATLIVSMGEEFFC